jgi:hypothetical protein
VCLNLTDKKKGKRKVKERKNEKQKRNK